jgi:hypothetical protein
MGRKIGLGVLLAVAALIVAAVLMQREPPPMPPDQDHFPAVANLAALGPDRACLDCHGPAGRKPRGQNHPLANDCGRCHMVRAQGRR